MTSKTKVNKHLRCQACGENDYEFVCQFDNCPHTHDKIHALTLIPKTKFEREYVHLAIYIKWYTDFLLPTCPKNNKTALRLYTGFLEDLQTRLEALVKSAEFQRI